MDNKNCFKMPIENDLETYPFEMDHLPDYFKEKCTAELKENLIARTEGLKELKELVKSHKLLRDINFVDDFLVQYLRNRKYDVHKAFQHVITYVNYVNNYSYMFKRVDVDKYYSIPYELFFTPLPNRCQDGCTIIYYEFGKWDPELCPVEEFKPLSTALYCQAIRDPMTQINGYKIIFDFTDTTFKQFKCFTPQNLYLYYKGVLDALPGRMKQIILIDNSFLSKIAFTIFVGFATEKVKQRIVVKKYSKELVDILPASCLPVHCGGTLKEYYMKEWWSKAAESMDKPTYSQPNYY
ncbi:hypothetical protein JTE90_025460 [Oedothorax gibbosus]|uniref:CRAL-TRIO domain-containing protein n=1 Tax=Oedothorax gibbosus TaxID=931172 RepID=A0AAV6U2J8_9ARAC|nr:hypothetical protein JTE90_025460 [Oedothorax gibbosus]